ncbi:MAG: carbohydrate ABC transporter substrate-binding protein [Lachnospiraceae bacterium]|nr:carbohydrate ABC transporter substrate-binding protein [Lachnospiraceae bacterium]
MKKYISIFALILGLLLISSCAKGNYEMVDNDVHSGLDRGEYTALERKTAEVVSVSVAEYLDEIHGIVKCGERLIMIGEKDESNKAVALGLKGEFISDSSIGGDMSGYPYIYSVQPLTDERFIVFYCNSHYEPQYSEGDTTAKEKTYRYKAVIYDSHLKTADQKEEFVFEDAQNGAVVVGNNTLFWEGATITLFDKKGEEKKVELPSDAYVINLICDLNANTYAYCINAQSIGLFRINLSELSLTDFYTMPQERVSPVQYGNRSGHICILTDNTIYRFIPEEGSFSEGVKRIVLPSGTKQISSFLDIEENEFCYCCEEEPVLYFVTVKTIEDQRIHITVGAVIGQNARLESYVSYFNSINDDYAAEIRWYTNPMQLNADIAAGNVPDVLHLPGSKIPLNDGVFMDLLPLIEQDDGLSKEDFTGNILKALEIDGKVLCLFEKFAILTCTGRTEVFGNRTGLSLEELNAILASDENLSVFPEWMTAEEFLLWICELSPGWFIDYDTYTCSFDNEDYVALLEFCLGSCPLKPDFDSYVSDYEPDILLCPEEIRNPGRVGAIENNYGLDSYTFTGFPNDRGENGSFYTGAGGLQFAMPHNSPNPGGGYVLIKGIFTERWQENVDDLPAIRKIYEARCDVVDEDNVQLSDNARKQFEELMMKTTSFLYDDNEMRDIILDEARDFFYGKKGAEEVAKLTQERISIYLQERQSFQ